ncbi:DUF551 domain-containing protein [Escherichia coli]|uniref:DUF551 domain-containing protein n=1 Tax=Escherichia coli TaxID=562 RepID=UPI0010B4F8A7|nr:DUF551 domain-containing protein [Escherichia coli]GCH62093.1 hypothetical protein BvCmsJ77A_03780 [Escherichia coli]
MESNIKGLVAAGHEMASELKAECGAVDMRSVAKLISDLATQLEVQLVRANALAEDQQKAIESIKQADAAVKLAHEKFSALAAENAKLKKFCKDAAFDADYEAELGMERGGFSDAAVQKVLDNLSQQKLVHRDVLPFSLPVTPDGWISCSERMPEETKMLLAFSQGEIVAAYWNWVVNPIDYKKYRAFTYLSGNILDDVTHWMPLPEPPQEVNRG